MVLSHTQSRGDELLARLLRGEAGSGLVENSLLRELQAGYPVSKVRLLLKSVDNEVVAAGIWIASELGGAARPLLSEIAGLIQHPMPKVRFFSLDCLATCGRAEDGETVAHGLDLLGDAEPSVRWKAMVFLATAPEILLRAVRGSLTADEQTARRRGLEVLLNPRALSAELVTDLASRDPIARAYAAAAAVRLAPQDPRYLKQAIQSTDPTIARFAIDMAARAGITVTG
jgi:hypothetical protein